MWYLNCITPTVHIGHCSQEIYNIHTNMLDAAEGVCCQESLQYNRLCDSGTAHKTSTNLKGTFVTPLRDFDVTGPCNITPGPGFSLPYCQCIDDFIGIPSQQHSDVDM